MSIKFSFVHIYIKPRDFLITSTARLHYILNFTILHYHPPCIFDDGALTRYGGGNSLTLVLISTKILNTNYNDNEAEDREADRLHPHAASITKGCSFGALKGIDLI
jgi:hypothetical protein